MPSSSRRAAASASALPRLARCHQQRRHLATPTSASPLASGSGASEHRVLVVGGGAAGQAVSHQLLRSGVFPDHHDIAVIDPKSHHDYQPGWTLVGAGLKDKHQLRRPMSELSEDGGLAFYPDAVESFDPQNNRVKTRDGKVITYEHLVVVPGLGLQPEKVQGLTEALADPSAPVSSIYDYNSCDTVYDYITNHKKGPAIFTQPPQPHKCAGAPQKIMWFAHDYWTQQGRRSEIPVTFATALPAMFSVAKYSKVLDELRKERDVEGLFQHNLASIEGSTATFTGPSGDKVTRPFSFLHATPPQGPLSFIRSSPLANAQSGFIDVDAKTTQHVKYPNVWSVGDSSSLPTSKTAAAITAQAPVLVSNLIRSALGAERSQGAGIQAAEYDGYTSCPIPTEYGKLLLCEFKYGGEIKESFGGLPGLDQGQPNRAFYHLKKDFFPWVYFNSMVRGTWAGPKGWSSGNSPGIAAPKPTVGGQSSRAFGTSASGSRRGFATSARTQRNTLSRRPKDPLDTDPTAVKYALPSGETFIVRPSPASGSAYSSAQGTVLESPKAESYPFEAGSSTLPPALKPAARRNRDTSTEVQLTPQQITQMQRLRARDPLRNTPRKLAQQFGCSELYVRIVAPASKDVRSLRNREEQARLSSRTFGEVLKEETRRARREMW